MAFFMFIRFFSLLMIALYSYVRILNIEYVSKQVKCASIVFSLVLAVPLSFQPPFYELLFLISVYVFVAFATRRKISLMLCAVFIATGVSIGINNLVTSILYDAIAIPLENAYINTIAEGLGIAIQSVTEENFNPFYALFVYYMLPCMELGASVVAAKFFFRMKRLKHGFAFMECKEARWGGMIFSLLIMLCYSFWPILTSGENAAWGIELFLVLVSHICALGIHIWWRNHTTLLYRQHMKERAVADMQAELDEKTKEIAVLQHSNQFLEKAVHRDNKLLPAMALTVKQYERQFANTKEDREKIAEFGSELDALLKERGNMLREFQRQYKTLPSTGIACVDSILRFMAQKATENNILFDVTVASGAKEAAKRSLPKEQLATILADTLENALIAIRHSTGARQRIRVNMEVHDGCFSLSVQDSGIPFRAETLEKLGKEKVTTHADEGGSGVGYMAIFEILREFSASIQITRHDPPQDGLTKTISMRFDGKGEILTE